MGGTPGRRRRQVGQHTIAQPEHGRSPILQLTVNTGERDFGECAVIVKLASCEAGFCTGKAETSVDGWDQMVGIGNEAVVLRAVRRVRKTCAVLSFDGSIRITG